MGLFDWLTGKKKAEPEVTPHEHFTRELEQLLRAKPNVSVRRGDEPLVLVVTVSGREMSAFLGNLFHDTREVDPEQRATMLSRFVSGIADPEPEYDTLEEAREVLAVTLRGSMGAMGQGVISREFVPCLAEYLVLDGEHRIAYCTREKVEQSTSSSPSVDNASPMQA